jgi:hypothetical protein
VNDEELAGCRGIMVALVISFAVFLVLLILGGMRL